MSLPSVPLQTLVVPVGSWNPQRAHPDHTFTYIDLSAVDQITKAINGARVLRCGDAPSRARQLVASRDVLVATVRPNLNGVAYVPDELDGATASTGFCVLRAREEQVDSRYLFHWVKAPAFVAGLVRKATGASYPAVSDRIILESSIPLPELGKQRRIAEMLDRVDVVRAKRRLALAELEMLPEAVFEEMFGGLENNPFGWSVVELKSVVRSDTTVTYGIVQAGDEFPGGVPYIRTGDIVDGEIRLEGLRHTDPAVAARSARSRVHSGDLVISIRATVGTVATVPPALDGANLTQGTARIAPGPQVDPAFLLAHLRSASCQDWISKQVKGATFREITLARLRELPVLMPPLHLQRDFAHRAATMGKLKKSQRTSLAELNSLFASLQHRAFRGEL